MPQYTIFAHLHTSPWLALNISTLQWQSTVVLRFEMSSYLEARDLFTWAEVTMCGSFRSALHTVTTISSREGLRLRTHECSGLRHVAVDGEPAHLKYNIAKPVRQSESIHHTRGQTHARTRARVGRRDELWAFSYTCVQRAVSGVRRALLRIIKQRRDVKRGGIGGHGKEGLRDGKKNIT